MGIAVYLHKSPGLNYTRGEGGSPRPVFPRPIVKKRQGPATTRRLSERQSKPANKVYLAEKEEMGVGLIREESHVIPSNTLKTHSLEEVGPPIRWFTRRPN